MFLCSKDYHKGGRGLGEKSQNITRGEGGSKNGQKRHHVIFRRPLNWTLLIRCRLLSKKYGDIFSIMVGTRPLVILNSYKLIKEATSRQEFSGRPNIFSGTFFQKGKTGVTTTEGPTWEAQRAFLHSQMVQFASSKAFQVLTYC